MDNWILRLFAIGAYIVINLCFECKIMTCWILISGLFGHLVKIKQFKSMIIDECIEYMPVSTGLQLMAKLTLAGGLCFGIRQVARHFF